VRIHGRDGRNSDDNFHIIARLQHMHWRAHAQEDKTIASASVRRESSL